MQISPHNKYPFPSCNCNSLNYNTLNPDPKAQSPVPPLTIPPFPTLSPQTSFSKTKPAQWSKLLTEYSKNKNIRFFMLCLVPTSRLLFCQTLPCPRALSLRSSLQTINNASMPLLMVYHLPWHLLLSSSDSSYSSFKTQFQLYFFKSLVNTELLHPPCFCKHTDLCPLWWWFLH